MIPRITFSPDAFKTERMSTTRLAVRVDPGNRNHHLWNNHGTWWVHYTLHLADSTKQRVRASLGTPDVRQARTRRDRLMASPAWRTL